MNDNWEALKYMLSKDTSEDTMIPSKSLRELKRSTYLCLDNMINVLLFETSSCRLVHEITRSVYKIGQKN